MLFKYSARELGLIFLNKNPDYIKNKKLFDEVEKKFNVEKMCFSTYSEYKKLFT